MRTARTTIFVLVSILMVSVHVGGQGKLSPLMPPQSNAFGFSFEALNVLQTQWAIDSELGGKTLSSTARNVQFLPGAILGSGPVFNVTLRAGTPFVSAPLFLFGERYDNPSVPDDDPSADFVDEFFA